MSKRRACSSGKVRYRDLEQAKRALRRIRSESTRDRIQTGVYRCPRCNGIHLTSSGLSTSY